MIKAGGKTWETRWVQSVNKAIVFDLTGTDNLQKALELIAKPEDLGQVGRTAIICAYHSAKHNEGFEWSTLEEFGDAVEKHEDVAQATVDFCTGINEYFGIKSQEAGDKKTKK